jgi:hypothetical protein
MTKKWRWRKEKEEAALFLLCLITLLLTKRLCRTHLPRSKCTISLLRFKRHRLPWLIICMPGKIHMNQHIKWLRTQLPSSEAIPSGRTGLRPGPDPKQGSSVTDQSQAEAQECPSSTLLRNQCSLPWCTTKWLLKWVSNQPQCLSNTKLLPHSKRELLDTKTKTYYAQYSRCWKNSSLMNLSLSKETLRKTLRSNPN